MGSGGGMIEVLYSTFEDILGLWDAAKTVLYANCNGIIWINYSRGVYFRLENQSLPTSIICHLWFYPRQIVIHNSLFKGKMGKLNHKVQAIQYHN